MPVPREMRIASDRMTESVEHISNKMRKHLFFHHEYDSTVKSNYTTYVYGKVYKPKKCAQQKVGVDDNMNFMEYIINEYSPNKN